MKITLNLANDRLLRAKKEARRRVEARAERQPSYRFPDRSVGDPRSGNPLEALSWQDLRSEIYGDH